MRKLFGFGLLVAGIAIGCQAKKTTTADACSHCPGMQKADANGACEMCHGKDVNGKCTVCDAPKT